MSTGTNRTVESARSILAGLLEDSPTEMNIEILTPEHDFMVMKPEKLAKYPNIQAVQQYLNTASVINQTQNNLGQDAMILANVSWKDAQGIESAKILF